MIEDIKDLEGKTISKATQMKLKEYDDDGFLLLEFADKSKCLIEASYGGYTGDSENEYPTYISIAHDSRIKELELIEEGE